MALAGAIVSLGVFIAIYGIFALGLNVKYGYTGLLDIGHVAFYLIGAYVSALLVAPPAETQGLAMYILGLNWPWVPALIVGVLVAGFAGMLVALPAIRLREDYLAISLLGIGVVIQRVVRNESWLVNGPRTFSGYDLLLGPYFPLPKQATAIVFGLSIPAGALLLGLLVGFVYAVVTYALSAWILDQPLADHPVLKGLLGVTSLGIPYLAAVRDDTDPLYLSGGVGLLTGVIGIGLALGGLSQLVVAVFFGAAAVFSWVAAVSTVHAHYRDLSRRDFGVAIGLGGAFVVVFIPIGVLGGGSANLASQIAMVVTALLLSGYLYGVYRLSRNWDRYGSETAFLRIVGVTTLVIVGLRYFVVTYLTSVLNQGIPVANADLIRNVVWLIDLGALNNPTIGYNRFMLVFSIAVLALVYLALESTVNSPFGRVLRAIREDEDVATALGKNTFSYKVQSMVLGSALAGLAGGIWAIFAQGLSYNMFAPRITFLAFLMVIIGGTANNRGVILGSAIYWAFNQGTADVAGLFPPAARSSVLALRLTFIGALLILILYYRPEGVWGEKKWVTPAGAEDS